HLAPVLNAPADAVHPLLAWATRLLDAANPILAEQRIGASDWDQFRARIRHAADRTDLIQLADLLQQASSAQPRP
ncbi:hypothetical protein, partial [Microbacterium lacticum]